ncbi:molybdopterin-dependent oxidoreductase [Thermoflexus sp.]|jgi:putative selenate reductase molybdopterin-binding subunit|uniref:molybdopterin-dependent oxidoreductase n=1 Tax=Thermoflexus sp. TaxID=1969742 RepID=UPI003C0A9FFA
MEITVTVNGERRTFSIAPSTRLLDMLRRAGYYGVKHGCDDGSCGMCTVLLDGTPILACVTLAAKVDGRSILTVEGVGRTPELGWRRTEGLHPIQEAFVETGAIQCGFCTPALVLAAKALLDRNPNPTEAEVREAFSGILCRCTGYLKPVQAVLRAAARMRGEPVPPIEEEARRMIIPPEGPIPLTEALPAEEISPPAPEGGPGLRTRTIILPTIVLPQPVPETRVVGKPEKKVDALRLVQGKPAFTDDFELRGMLYAKVLKSPVPHARIKRIDVSKARALPGVVAVLTYQDLPRVIYSTAGQSDPIPGPLDTFSLDSKVRFVGDRVAFVAAETPEIAEKALELIEVEYEELPAILDPRDAMKPGAPIIHDEPEYVPFDGSDPSRNLAAQIHIEIGEVDKGFEEADYIFEGEYIVPKVQQSSLETHVVITYWDEDDRLVIRTSTQVPFHVRRILAPVLGLPPKRIRVIKPRIGGGFGGKQEVLIEDIAAHLTIATGRPVRLEWTREEEFTAARSRHPMRIRLRTGVKRDGTIVANEMVVLSDTGAYGSHALTVAGNAGHKAMALYPAWDEKGEPRIRFHADVVYTNTPPSGAFRGYGVPQGFFAVEVHMERIARALGLDPLEFRLKNALKAGQEHPFSRAWSEGREPRPEIVHTCGLPECVRYGAAYVGWHEKFGNPEWHRVPGRPHLRRGIGVACVMQGTAIPYLDMGAASLKMNDDGSFNLLIGATDLGTGSDTVIAQMVAEVLGCAVEDIIVYSSDTDFTPFDKGAYASSTTYISGAAAVRAAEQVAEQIKEVAAALLSERGAPVSPAEIRLADRRAWAPDGRSVTLEEVALSSLHHRDQRQIMAVASYVSPVSPPPFAAQFAEVTVDIETGEVRVDRLVMAVDAGRIVNPLTASGQVEGGMIQALGYAVSEEMVFDERGRVVNPRFGPYKIFQAHEVPELGVIFIETVEPTHPFGIKAVAEIPMDGVAPAVVNAIYDAVGVWITQIPATPERVWRALREARTEETGSRA